MNPYSVICPKCGAPVGKPCYTQTGRVKRMERVHKERRDFARPPSAAPEVKPKTHGV